MGLVRALLKTAHEAVEAGVDKALGPPPASAVHPGEPLPPQPQHDPLAPLSDYMEERGERHGDERPARRRRDKKGAPAAAEPRGGPLGRLNLVIAMTRDAEQREIHALRSAALWGVSLIVVGLIFMILTATGEFPTSVANLKGMGIYDDYIAKYCLYMFAGAIAFVAAAFARRGLRAGRSTAVEQGVLLLALLVAVATIGMSIWLDVRVNEFESSPWWSWLILVLIIFQRTVFSIACAMSIWTLRLAAGRVGDQGEASSAEGEAAAAGGEKAKAGAAPPGVADVV